MEKLLNKVYPNALCKAIVVVTGLICGNSCTLTPPDPCRWGREMYHEEWNYIVSKVYRYKKFKATWVVETTSGKELFIRPNQPIVSIAEPGDKLIKEKNSAITLIVKMNSKDKDTLESRLFSPSCDDDIMEKGQKERIN